MNYSKPFKLLKSLPNKLNNFYNKNSKSSLKIDNKSKDKKKFDPVTNLDKDFEKLDQIIKRFKKLGKKVILPSQTPNFYYDFIYFI